MSTPPTTSSQGSRPPREDRDARCSSVVSYNSLFDAPYEWSSPPDAAASSDTEREGGQSPAASNSLPKPQIKRSPSVSLLDDNLIPVPCQVPPLDFSCSQVLNIFETFKNLEQSDSSVSTADEIQMRLDVDRLMFYDFSNHWDILDRMLDHNIGLRSIINSSRVPYHIKHDVEYLWEKWSNGDLNPSMLRGALPRRHISGGRLHYRLLENYPFRRHGNFIGSGHLYNGQWWPKHCFMLRDGAHNSTEAGISGNSTLGATSIILSTSSNHRYTDDVDNGDRIVYCGNIGKNGVASAKTNLLLHSASKRSPIRVIRAAKLQSKYAPREGLRYDGLYEIYNHRLVDEQTARYLFSLKRCPGQTPIRFEGIGIRPTEMEIQQWKCHSELMLSSRSQA